jgi:Rrf2 family transcriptional regulator, cysteine metabolism repressor
LLAITTKSRYAVSALVELALRGATSPVPIGEVARRREIPVQFLESLFSTLRRGGVLRSQRGVGGGYCFARRPEEVTVLAVVELLEGPLGAERPPPGSVWADLLDAARNVLGATTIADIAQREASAAGAPMYYI